MWLDNLTFLISLVGMNQGLNWIWITAWSDLIDLIWSFFLEWYDDWFDDLIGWKDFINWIEELMRLEQFWLIGLIRRMSLIRISDELIWFFLKFNVVWQWESVTILRFLGIFDVFGFQNIWVFWILGIFYFFGFSQEI